MAKFQAIRVAVHFEFDDGRVYSETFKLDPRDANFELDRRADGQYLGPNDSFMERVTISFHHRTTVKQKEAWIKSFSDASG